MPVVRAILVMPVAAAIPRLEVLATARAYFKAVCNTAQEASNAGPVRVLTKEEIDA